MGCTSHTDFSLIFTLRRTEKYDFFPKTDLLFYDIISTTSWQLDIFLGVDEQTGDYEVLRAFGLVNKQIHDSIPLTGIIT